jgi:hypothetical protein
MLFRTFVDVRSRGRHRPPHGSRPQVSRATVWQRQGVSVTALDLLSSLPGSATAAAHTLQGSFWKTRSEPHSRQPRPSRLAAGSLCGYTETTTSRQLLGSINSSSVPISADTTKLRTIGNTWTLFFNFFPKFATESNKLAEQLFKSS